MRFGGTLLIVDDIEKSKKFYQEILNQQITMDLGEHVAFENGLALQSGYENIIGKPLKRIQGANNFQIYFEVNDINECEAEIKKNETVVFLHPMRAYSWGQRSIRIYDVDENIIEIAETMDAVIKNYIGEGLSVEEISRRTMYPTEYIKNLMGKDSKS